MLDFEDVQHSSFFFLMTLVLKFRMLSIHMPNNVIIQLFSTVSLHTVILFVTYFDSCFPDPIIINSV